MAERTRARRLAAIEATPCTCLTREEEDALPPGVHAGSCERHGKRWVIRVPEPEPPGGWPHPPAPMA